MTSHPQRTESVEPLLVLDAFASTSTAASWTMLDTVVNKINKKYSWMFTPREVDAILVSVGDAKLREAGVFRTSFGARYMSIVLTNPAFAKALASGAPCQCGIAKDEAGDKVSTEFSSTAYGAGKHNAHRSGHLINCTEWRPPGAGHLHSWRRSYEDEGRK